MRLQHQVPEKVPEGSGAFRRGSGGFRCRQQTKFGRVSGQIADEVPEAWLCRVPGRKLMQTRFWRVLVQMADEVLEGFADKVPAGSGADGR